MGVLGYVFQLIFFFVFSSGYVISLDISIFTFYMFVDMHVHALTPPACGLSFICNKVLFRSVLQGNSVCCVGMERILKCSSETKMCLFIGRKNN